MTATAVALALCWAIATYAVLLDARRRKRHTMIPYAIRLAVAATWQMSAALKNIGVASHDATEAFRRFGEAMKEKA